MKKILALFVIVALSVYNAICFVSGNPKQSKLVLSAVYDQGILGSFKNKVGGVVGKNWKAINYMSGYAKPSNPDTPAQQNQRSKMRRSVEFGRQILGTIIQPMWDPFYNESSGWAEFIKNNILMFGASPSYDNTVNNVISKGGITKTQITAPNVTSPNVVVNWSTSLSGNQLATDIMFGIVVKQVGGEVVGFVNDAVRSAGTDTIACAGEVTDDDIVYVGFRRADSVSPFEVSDSDSQVLELA